MQIFGTGPKSCRKKAAALRAAYKSMQAGKNLDVPKAGTIVDDLSARFPGRKKKKSHETVQKE